MELKRIRGIGIVYEKKLMEAGVRNVEELALADIEAISSKTGIGKERLQKWKEEAKKLVDYKEAEIAEDISKVSFVEINGEKAKVRIKEIWHENVPVFRGNFDELKSTMENEEMAVYKGKKIKLWFNKKWYDDIPSKTKEKKKSFLDKLLEWWKK